MNLKKRSNKNGFTLVELLIVVALFGAIMSAVLNFLRPANEIHNNALATRDANLISSGLIECVDDELRYATSILVLQDYPGVPQVSSNGVICGGAYTDCIMIDNYNPRGFTDNNYDPDKFKDQEAYPRGSIIKIPNLRATDSSNGGLDFSKSEVLMGVDYYDRFTYGINVGSNMLDLGNDYNDMSLRTLQINLTAYQPVYENGKFVFKSKFDRDSNKSVAGTIEKNKGAVINLSNINSASSVTGNGYTISNDLRIHSFTSKWKDASDLPKQQTVVSNIVDECKDVIKCPQQQTAPSGLNANQESLYDYNKSIKITNKNGVKADVIPRYTYIFYHKPEARSNTTVTYINWDGHPDTAKAGQPCVDAKNVINGIDTNVEISKKYKLAGLPDAPVGYTNPHWFIPDYDGVGKHKNAKSGEEIDLKGDTIIYFVCDKESKPLNTFLVVWYDPDNKEIGRNNIELPAEGQTFTGNEKLNPPPGSDPSWKWKDEDTATELDKIVIDRTTTSITMKAYK